MANIVDISKITGINQVGNSYQRKSAVPLDYYSLFNTKAEAETYAASNPVSYVGQVISYIDNNEVKVCVIADAAGTLNEVGKAPLGDSKTIEVSAAGAVSLLGAATAGAGTLPMLEEVEVEGQKVTKLVWKTLEQIGAGDGNDNTTYVFEYKEDEQKLYITTKENGVEKADKQIIDLSAFVTTEELAEVVGAPAEGETAATGLYKVIADALAEAKKHADDNDANTEYHLEYDSTNKEIKLVAGADAGKMVIDAGPFIKDGMLHDVSYDAASNTLTFTWNTDEGSKTDTVELTDILDPYTFEAGAKLDVAVEGAKVTYSHETVADPTASAGSGRTYLTGVTTDGYGHITGYTTASESDQDLSDYKTKQTVYSAEGSTIKTVTKVEQNENGEVVVTYEEIAFPEFPEIPEDTNTTYTLADATGEQDKVQLTLTPSEGDAQTVNVNAYSAKKVDALLQGKADADKIPTKVSQLENDNYYLKNVKMRDASEESGYAPLLAISKTGTEVVVDDEALQNVIAGVKATADGAVKKVETGANNGTIKVDGSEVAVKGLGSAAYTDSSAYAPADIDVGVKKVESGATNGTIKVDEAEVAVAGLKSAAYSEASAFDAAGSAAAVLGANTDAAGAATVHGALNKAAAVLGTESDGSAAKTVYGAHAAVKNLADGAVKTNTEAIAELKEQIGDVSNIMNFRGVVPYVEGSDVTTEAAKIIKNIADGDVIIYGEKEYVRSGSIWVEFGDASGNASAISKLQERVGAIEGWKPVAATNEKAGLIKGTAHTVTDGVTTGTGVHIEGGEVKSVSTDLLVNGAFELILCGGSASV